MKLYNTMSKQKEEFVPLEEGKVRMYVCGPTVYNFIHIGNARPMIVFDTVRRYFEYKGYDVNYVSNFTDVDDKIINKAIEEGTSADEVSKRFIAECKKDMAGMNVKPATKHPLATEEICGMVDMIQILIDKGYAYEKNGTVYYRTRQFKDYGKLSHKNLDDLRSGERSLLVTGEDEKKIHWISYFGNRRKKASHHGSLLGLTVVRVGILSVQRCPRNILASRLIFTPVVKTLYFHIMKMRSLRVRRQMVKNLQNTGCTTHF